MIGSSHENVSLYFRGFLAISTTHQISSNFRVHWHQLGHSLGNNHRQFSPLQLSDCKIIFDFRSFVKHESYGFLVFFFQQRTNQQDLPDLLLQKFTLITIKWMRETTSAYCDNNIRQNRSLQVSEVIMQQSCCLTYQSG